MLQCNLYEAKTRLSQLVQSALEGEEVLIARAGKPAVRLVPIEPVLRQTGGMGALTAVGALSPEALDAAFSPEVEAEVVALFGHQAGV